MFSLSAKMAPPTEKRIKPSSEMCFTFLASTLALFQPQFHPKFFLTTNNNNNNKKIDVWVPVKNYNYCIHYWFSTYLYWVTWNVVITYIFCFHKMLVKGLVTMVLYGSGRTDKWKEESNFPVSSKEKEYGHFHLQNPLSIRLYRHFCATFCSTASGHNIFLITFFFSEDIISL